MPPSTTAHMTIHHQYNNRLLVDNNMILYDILTCSF
jgi:hypothetical protein